MRIRRKGQKRREKKKTRADAAKERQRQQLGISNNAFEVAGEEDLFSFATAAKVGSIEGIELPDLDPDEYQEISEDDEEFSTVRKRELIVVDDDLDEQ